ncbi:dihydrofolate synthase / folylpolyglutamate synthase [Thermotomaculum hydrothermale]|uniref:Dihydrofolate synthase/folylpolyglutamate synthase n=1 Tax=Thermotomaculum hydrothermale TaxID=981385 RepID=A0A7R6PSE1_9BACT|nr:folylpolyglutamate synthase/dihydrofolate synthase family protein [Thermotomaculum hydrothermale]BBB33476.1 dihydrofolate synthase / folylpolyglutamate synthase [Thermotomaculum hydrothermale]
MREPFFYHEALEYVRGFEKSKIKLGLERIEKALKSFDNPQDKFKSIHIAGTNGKGSVGAYLDSLLASKDNFVGRFCSPHLITPRERILIDGKPITRQWFAASVSMLRDKIEEENLELSYFEFFTLLCYYVFSFLKVDYGIVETGLGGRLDSTNTLKHPEITIITSLSKDHTKFLGETVSSIAGEKAGIIKPGIPVVTSAEGEALLVIDRECKKKSAPLYTLKSLGFEFDGSKVVLKELGISANSVLKGNFQAENLCLALAAFSLLTGEKGDFSEVIKSTKWPARMEEFDLSENKKLIVDGAHNVDAIKKVIEDLNPSDNSVLIFGCMKDKSVNEMFNIVKSKFKNIVLTAGDYHRFMKEEDFKDLGIINRFEKLEKLPDFIENYDEIFVLGSLHLAGDFLKTLYENGKYKNALLEKEPYSYIFDDYPY